MSRTRFEVIKLREERVREMFTKVRLDETSRVLLEILNRTHGWSKEERDGLLGFRRGGDLCCVVSAWGFFVRQAQGGRRRRRLGQKVRVRWFSRRKRLGRRFMIRLFAIFPLFFFLLSLCETSLSLVEERSFKNTSVTVKTKLMVKPEFVYIRSRFLLLIQMIKFH